MGLLDVLKNIGLLAADVGAQGVQDVAGMLQQRANPQWYAQDQLNQRQQSQQEFESKQAGELTAYQKAEIDRQNRLDAQNQGLTLWNIMRSGATRTPQNGSPDFSFGGQGFNLPRTYSISKDSPHGKALGLNEDLTGLSAEEYVNHVMPVMEKLSVAQDKQSWSDLNAKQLQGQLAASQDLIRRRYSPEFYQSRGFKPDPMAGILMQNALQQLQDALSTDTKTGKDEATRAVMQRLFENGSYETAQQALLNRQAQNAATAASRADMAAQRSYQFHATELGKIAKPWNDVATRFGRLEDLAKQHTPQADAMLGPELPSVMVGGAGSGLRMNEAEIARVIGGRSKWESLKASLQQWSTDPSKANSITDSQRAQIAQLMGEVRKRIVEKQGYINQGFNELAVSNDPMEHRKIFTKYRSLIGDLDTGGSTSEDALVKKYGGNK
jgi:hypothetical protein